MSCDWIFYISYTYFKLRYALHFLKTFESGKICLDMLYKMQWQKGKYLKLRLSQNCDLLFIQFSAIYISKHKEGIMTKMCVAISVIMYASNKCLIVHAVEYNNETEGNEYMIGRKYLIISDIVIRCNGMID